MTHQALTAPNVCHYIAGGVYAKQWEAQYAGDFLEQHVHAFDHLSFLGRGIARVIVDGQSTVYKAPTAINIKAGKAHRVEAVSGDVLWLCIHAIPEDLRDADEIEGALILK